MIVDNGGARKVILVGETLKGGLGAAVLKDAERAAQSGGDVVVVAPSADKVISDSKGITAFPVGIPSSFRSVRKALAARRALNRCLRRNRHAVVHVHGLRSLLLVLPRRKVIVTYHGGASLPGSSSVVQGLREIFLFAIPYLVSEARTVSPLRNRRWTRIWINSPNADMQLAPREYREGIRLLWLSRVSPQKNFRLFCELVEAIRTWSDFESAVVVGDVDTRIADDVRGLANGLPINFLGRQENVSCYFSEDVIFCLFSHFEGRPFALEEAIRAFVPVIATDLPGNRLMVSEARLVQTAAEAVARVEALRTPEARKSDAAVAAADFVERRREWLR